MVVIPRDLTTVRLSFADLRHEALLTVHKEEEQELNNLRIKGDGETRDPGRRSESPER